LLSYQDSFDVGIPDWWQLYYFGVVPINPSASAANDGFSNLQKYEMGLNPTNYYNPNPPGNFLEAVDASGTNAFLYWSPAAGPVVNYVVQRISTNFGVAYYNQVGLLSSNATWVEDKGAVTNANPQNVIYNLWAVYPGGSTSATDSCQVAQFTGALPPNNVYAYADGSGTNFVVSWTSASPSATNYLLFRHPDRPGRRQRHLIHRHQRHYE
jgi:hypothetical protein